MSTTAVREPAFVIDVVFESHRSSAARPPRERTAAWLQLIQRQRAQDAAREAEFILRLAALCPDEDDPPPDPPGAARTYWRSARSEFPGVSEFFLDELAAVLGVGRGTAAHKATRAFTWRLPAGHLRRAQDDLHHPVLPVPAPPPAEDLRPGLAVPDGTRRHPARHHPLRHHPDHPALGAAPTTTTRTTPGRPTAVLATRRHVGSSTWEPADMSARRRQSAL